MPDALKSKGASLRKGSPTTSPDSTCAFSIALLSWPVRKPTRRDTASMVARSRFAAAHTRRR